MREGQRRFRDDEILERVTAATYESTESGEFVDPSPALAQLFLGDRTAVARLAQLKVQTFYAVPEQRELFLRKMKELSGRSITEALRLRLGQEQRPQWCRCTSCWDADSGHFIGTIALLDTDELMVPGKLLTQTGWAYFRTDHEGRTVFASDLHARLVGATDLDALIRQCPSDTHWNTPADWLAFVQDTVQSPRAPHPAVFRHQSRGTLWAELYCIQNDQMGLEAFWHDVSLLADVPRSVEDLEGDTLPEWEHALTKVAARISPVQAAGLYRTHTQDGRRSSYILRAERGLPSGSHLPRVLEIPSDGQIGTSPLVNFAWPCPVREVLVPMVIDRGEQPDHVGALWVVLDGAALSPEEVGLRRHASDLGALWISAEKAAAQRTEVEGVQLAIEHLVRRTPDRFYKEFTLLAQRAIHTQAASFLLARQLEERTELEMVWTTGIRNVAPTGWHNIRYTVGERDRSLTGVLASQLVPVSLLDEDVERQRRNLDASKYRELQPSERQAWLGCPIVSSETNRQGHTRLEGYLRLVNHHLHATTGPAAGFSAGDVEIARRLATAAGKFLALDREQNSAHAPLDEILHEFRAPLDNIRGQVRRLRAGVQDRAETTRRLGAIYLNAELVLSLVNDIDYNVKHREPNMEWLSIDDDVFDVATCDTLHLLAVRYKYSSLQLNYRSLQDFPRIQADRGMLRQVFQNLLVNAIKYGPPQTGRTIQIDLEWSRGDDGHALQVIVRDWGMGIARFDADKIFRKHYRSAEAKARDPNGSGIGLHVVRGLLELHGGSIHLTGLSNPTVFVVTLPASRT